MEAPSSIKEIERKNPKAFDHFYAAKKADPTLNDHLVIHKPWIDQVTWQNPGEEGTYRRVPEVIDCWFDAGCMPFAQWGYPHKGDAQFKESFPADFISEAIDQTRGWFYSLLMISTLVFPDQAKPHPFKTCIVLGHVSDKEGKKESKSKGNYTPPEVILDRVAMEFAVTDPETASKHYKGVSFKGDVASNTAFIAPEDLEGLDLTDGAKVRISSHTGTGLEKENELSLHAKKGLPRRVVVLAPAAAKDLGVKTTETADVKPVEVPRLPVHERVTITDPTTPAPGADAFRWFFYASSPPWSATRHSLSNVRALQKEFAVKLRNVYSFFTIYANIDGFHPYGEKAKNPIAFAKMPELDRWILGDLAKTTTEVTKRLDAYDIYGATQLLTSFVDALSNWWVRRSRDRFWRSAKNWDSDDDKKSAYETLYESLVTLTKLTAPFTPFGAETMYRNLVARPASQAGINVHESVHLGGFPEDDGARFDAALSAKIAAVRDVVSVGLQVRTVHKLKVRQPLRAAHVIVSNPALLTGSAEAMLRDELNVLALHVYGATEAGRFVEYRLKPNFRTLGQRGLGKQAQELKKQMAGIAAKDAAPIVSELMSSGKVTFGGVELLRDDVEIEFVSKDGFAAAGDRVGVVVLETALDDELRDLGFLRELQSRVQAMRKDMGLEYSERIKLAIVGSDRAARVLAKYGAELAKEVLAVGEIATREAPAGATSREVEVEGEKLTIAIARA
jgi:isoleucyl-tRNA synthetase